MFGKSFSRSILAAGETIGSQIGAKVGITERQDAAQIDKRYSSRCKARYVSHCHSYLRTHVRRGTSGKREIGDQVKILEKLATVDLIVGRSKPDIEAASPKKAGTNLIPADRHWLHALHLIQQKAHLGTQLAVSADDPDFLSQLRMLPPHWY